MCVGLFSLLFVKRLQTGAVSGQSLNYTMYVIAMLSTLL